MLLPCKPCGLDIREEPEPPRKGCRNTTTHMSDTIKNLAWTAGAVVVGLIVYNLIAPMLPAKLRG